MENYEKYGLEKFMMYYITKFYNTKLENEDITVQSKDDLIRETAVKIYENIYKKMYEETNLREYCSLSKSNIEKIIDVLDEMGQLEKYAYLYDRRMEFRKLSKLSLPFNKEKLADELKANLCTENNILDVKKSEVIQTYYFNRLTKEIDQYAAVIQYLEMHPELLQDNTNETIRNELKIGDTTAIDEQIVHEKNKLKNLEKQKSKSKKIKNLDFEINLSNVRKKIEDLEDKRNSILEKRKCNLTFKNIDSVFKDKIDFDELLDIYKINQMVKVDIIKENNKLVEKYGTELDLQDIELDDFYKDNYKATLQAWNELNAEITNKYKYLLNKETIEYMINNQTLQKVMYRVKDICIMSLIMALEVEKKYNFGYVDVRNTYTRYGNRKQFGNSIRNWGIVLNNENSIIEENGDKKKVTVKDDDYILAVDVANFNWPVTFHFKPDVILEHEIVDKIPVYKFSKLMQDRSNAKNNLLFGYPCKKELAEYLKVGNIDKNREELLMHLKFMQDGSYPNLPKTEYYDLEKGTILANNQIER